jgi:hypothetical protein
MKEFIKDQPTQVVIWLVMVLLFVVSITSCVEPQPLPNRTVRFRAKEATYNVSTGHYIDYGPIKIISVDSGYRTGDTINILVPSGLHQDYILYERVK